MGEAIVEASNKEVKIGEMGSSNPALQVSVSFGRFANDSLSWEKWSSFSPNKYLEEVEKCATPGSVAEKKAYFEEYYKKIAARKAELLAQEKPMESTCLSSDGENFGDLVSKSNVQCSDEGDKQETNLVSEANGIHYDELNEEPEIARDCQNSSVEGVKEKIDSTMEGPKLNKLEETAADEAVLLKQEVETLPKDSQDVKEQEPEKDIENAPMIKDKIVELDHLAKSHKTKPVNKDRNATRLKKKPASPVTKTPQFSTPRASKPTSTPTTLSALRTPSKTGNTLSSSLPKTKNPSVVESKKVASRSLHMSFSLGPPGSGAAPASLAAARKSLITEKMGDKDIVKRAFKTFQNNYNQLKLSRHEQSPVTKQVPAKGREPRFSTLTTPQKENGGSFRVSDMEKKNAKAPPSYFGLKSDERAERRKAFSKKLEENSNGREADRKYLQTKSKDSRDAEIKKLRLSHNFKATPPPGFYHAQRTQGSPLDKIGTKSDIHS